MKITYYCMDCKGTIKVCGMVVTGRQYTELTDYSTAALPAWFNGRSRGFGGKCFANHHYVLELQI